MDQKFERVGKHFFRRSYPVAGGNLSIIYYGIFTSKLKRKRRVFSLGSDLKQAREALKALEGRNVLREDFDKEREEREKAQVKAMTVGEWLNRYLELIKSKKSWSRD